MEDQREAKTKEVMLAKKELEFIEKELSNIGKYESTKIVEAAGSVVASINAKYELIKKELETIRMAHTRLKAEYENAKTELESFKIRFE